MPAWRGKMEKQNEGCGSTDRRHGSDITRLSRVGRHRTVLRFTKHVHQALTSFYFIHEKCKNCSGWVYDMRTTLVALWINLPCGLCYHLDHLAFQSKQSCLQKSREYWKYATVLFCNSYCCAELYTLNPKRPQNTATLLLSYNFIN